MYDERYIQNLRNKLKRRVEKLKSATPPNTYYFYLKQFINFISENFIFNSIIENLILKNNHAEKTTKNFITQRTTKEFLQLHGDLRAVTCYLVMKQAVDSGDENKPIHLGQRFQNSANPQRALELFNSHVLDLFFEYIEEKLDQLNIEIIFLSKYKHRSEWFYKEILFRLSKKKGRGGKKKIGETLLKTDMINYLYDQGIELEFREPLSPSGKVDLVLLQKGDKRLIIEGKLFTSKSEVKDSLNQVYVYTRDYNEPFGYLIIFNPKRNEIVLNLPSTDMHTPCVTYKNKTIFIITIDIYPYQKSASTREIIKPIEITERDLLDS